jgi:hypothetical protein
MRFRRRRGFIASFARGLRLLFTRMLFPRTRREARSLGELG